jgi:alpha-1,6-mannosyltransferase
MVIFKPDGSHGMYSWIHVGLATACAVGAWYLLAKAPATPDGRAVSKPRRPSRQ